MALNTTPIFVGTPSVQWGSTDGNGGAAGGLKTQNTALDGTGTVLTVFTADVTNGGVVNAVALRALGTNVATVLRVFINNGSTNATLANNTLIDEVNLPATAASANSATQLFMWVPMPHSILRLPAGYKLNVTLGTTVAAGYQITTFGGAF